ncbi:MAG: hypothetical protein MJ208_00410 [Bacilli bacterium]|nr:hypothetical protein [Bacilli bacterium]
MILIKVYGLDQYVVGNYSKEHTTNLAKLFETSEDEILFYAPNSYIFHKGVEQTSWNATIEVCLPEKYHPLQANVTKYLVSSFKLFSINLHILFTYFDQHHLFEHFNKDYPRFIRDDNLVKVEEEDLSEEDITDEDKVYTGNVFKDFNKKKK